MQAVPLEQATACVTPKCFSKIPLKALHHRAAVATETAGAESHDHEGLFLRTECSARSRKKTG